jgi:hypothetical protein
LIRRPGDGLVVSDGAWRWRISQEALRRIVDDVRREQPPHATGRERVRARTVALLQRQAEARRGDSPPEAWLRRMGRDPQVRAFLTTSGRKYPRAAGLLAPDRRISTRGGGRRCTDQRGAGAAAVWQRLPRTVKAATWSVADALLIDEAAGLIDRLPSYGHIVVDEAQDLSPMQCRALARRCEHGSLTLLGDLAQATLTLGTTDWRDTLTHLGKPNAHVVPHTVGFRVPAAVLALANQLLPALFRLGAGSHFATPGRCPRHPPGG